MSSSPPKRAAVSCGRSISRQTVARCTSAWSPALCLIESFSFVKLSMSSKATHRDVSCRAARATSLFMILSSPRRFSGPVGWSCRHFNRHAGSIPAPSAHRQPCFSTRFPDCLKQFALKFVTVPLKTRFAFHFQGVGTNAPVGQHQKPVIAQLGNRLGQVIARRVWVGRVNK